jgi:NAD(P)-dependent dehydrogenase (short-subunit alcohol dehydrogenase family)
MNTDSIFQTRDLAGHVAVVTGAGSGIGRAISLALSREGVQVCAVGRTASTLEETVVAVRRFSHATAFPIDLTVARNHQPLLQHIAEQAGRLDILIHSAGVIRPGPMECARIEDFDLQFATNTRAPYLLTQRLLHWLAITRGQIVFINSSAGLMANRPDVGPYGASKHALKAIADSLRAEVNPKGIRVLSLFLGQTATPMQEALYRQAGRPYQAEKLLQPEDVASAVIMALTLRSTAEVTDISIRPMNKP